MSSAAWSVDRGGVVCVGEEAAAGVDTVEQAGCKRAVAGEGLALGGSGGLGGVVREGVRSAVGVSSVERAVLCVGSTERTVGRAGGAENLAEWHAAGGEDFFDLLL